MADDIVTISEFIAKEVGFYSPGMLVQAQDPIAWLAEHGFAVVVADETERLRAENERLRAAGDALAEAALNDLPSNWVVWNVAAWQEARRG